MAFDFIITSQSGFKAVGHTQNATAGGYTSNLTYPQDIPSGPTNYAYTLYGHGEKVTKILSRIIPAGKDSIGRPGNFLAHHLVLENDNETKRAKCGPAFLLKRRSWLAKWEHDDFQKYLPSQIVENDYLPIKTLPIWMTKHSDWDWETDLLKKLEDSINNEKKYVIFYDGKKYSGEDILDIFYVAMSRIESERRWKIPFATSAASIHERLGWKWMGVDLNDEKSKPKLYPADWRGNPKPSAPEKIELP
ncbi:MAG: hypothetical protein FWC50_05850 [Planctomycetaceae bacterium]|nr:hypothetical protein [Planctomycetaceae bacterium]